MQNAHGSERSRKRRRAVSALLVVYDLAVVSLAYFLALWFRFDCDITVLAQTSFLSAWARFLPIYLVFCLMVFWLTNLYNSIWRFAGTRETVNITCACMVTTAFQLMGITAMFGRMPISYHVFGALIQYLLILAARFSARFILIIRSWRQKKENGSSGHRVMLIGAGAAGQMILKEMLAVTSISDKVVCIIDDDPSKTGCLVSGVPVVGGREAILPSVEKYGVERIFFAVPSASPEDKRAILEICKETGCELKSLPGIYQLVNDEVMVRQLQDVRIEDLLGREPIRVNMDEIYDNLTGKVILVTGGGGSIGSELCRQIASHNPKQLIIFDVYENNAYDIQLELVDKHKDLDIQVLIGSVRDSRRIQQVFATYRPEIVYHAAAHKHVPLMEVSPCEAIKNNPIGTFKTAYAAMLYGCKRFVLISTDKAVNPVNIMGASKRLCEMVIQAFDAKIKAGQAADIHPLALHSGDGENGIFSGQVVDFPATEFVAVRFGNVLGSNGSVIPIFREQIAKGGPVTVTHPDIIRYFMTIPEAVSLVLQAGNYARGGEIFVLDMGTPVKIDTLARNMIKLSGLKPDVDIKIEYTGLRPGEKLFEETLMANEVDKKTPNDLIYVGKPIPFDVEQFLDQLRFLMRAASEERDDIGELVAQVVPTYHPEKAGQAMGK